jgi:hypothetical protein
LRSKNKGEKSGREGKEIGFQGKKKDLSELK